eukprot:677836-Pleurochrysis_carterae.AAC.3
MVAKSARSLYLPDMVHLGSCVFPAIVSEILVLLRAGLASSVLHVVTASCASRCASPPCRRYSGQCLPPLHPQDLLRLPACARRVPLPR